MFAKFLLTPEEFIDAYFDQQRKLEDLRQEAEYIEDEIEMLGYEIDGFENDIDVLQKRIDALESERADKQETLEAAQTLITEQSKSLKMLQSIPEAHDAIQAELEERRAARRSKAQQGANCRSLRTYAGVNRWLQVVGSVLYVGVARGKGGKQQ